MLELCLRTKVRARYDAVATIDALHPFFVLSPVTNEQDSVTSILVGLLTLSVIGGILGLIMPKNEALPTPWYRTVSSCIGYTYFIMWSVSFYPQLINNFRRRMTHGLSADFCGLNVLGFACYSIYNIAIKQ